MLLILARNSLMIYIYFLSNINLHRHACPGVIRTGPASDATTDLRPCWVGNHSAPDSDLPHSSNCLVCLTVPFVAWTTDLYEIVSAHAYAPQVCKREKNY